MSGSRRTILDRRRRAVIAPETIQLFVELERTPARKRQTEEFKARDYALHEQLGLATERFCSQVSVLDRASVPCHPPGYKSHDDFWVVREVRQRLLAALDELGDRPAGARH